MPDAFISYSRKNIAFARILIPALEENGIKVWIDWQDIPPSADWLAEVYQAIEGSDAFIFIISENSVVSEVCDLEIEHAVKNHKRLIPIVVNEVEPSKVPTQLRALQWIFFNQEDQFSLAIKDLIEAIQIDQDWVKGHTRLQNRALEWERKGRANSALLRGQNLHQAETWIARAAGMNPAPTALQTEYIFASRKQTNLLQRVGISVAAACMVIAISLGIWAWTQRVGAVQTTQARATAEIAAIQEADTRATAQSEAVQEGLAKATAQAVLENQIQTVSARYLAARANSFTEQSISAENENLDLGLLLSVEALRLQNNLETRKALLTALTAQPYLDRFLFRASGVQFHDLLFNPQGDLIGINYEDQELLIFDLDQGKLLYQISTPHRIANVGHDLIDVATQDGVRFNLDGTLMITHAADRSWILWDATDYSPIGDPFPENVDGRSILSISPDFSLLATLDENIISIWEREGGKLVQTLEDIPEELNDLPVFSDDNKYLIIPSGERTFRVYEISSNELVQSIELESEFGKLSQFTISSQATHLGAVGSGSIVLYDLTTGEQLTNYLIAENTSYGLLFGIDGKAYLGYTQYIYNQEYEGYEEFTSLESLGEQNLLVSRFSPVSKWYYPTLAHMYSATNPLARMDPDSLRIVTRRSNMDNVELLVYDPMSIYPIFESVCFNRPMDNGDLPQQILFHPLQENLMAVAQCGEGARKSSCELIVWDLSNGPSSAHPPLAVDGPIQALAFHPQGDLMAIVTGDGNLEIWDWQQGVQISGIEGFINDITWLGFSSDGNYLVAKPKLTRDPITIWSFETGKIHSQIPSDVNGERKVLNIALHSQLPWLGIAYGDRAVVWDIEKQSQIAELRGVETHQIYDWITFHPAGKQLATGGKDGIVQWDLETFESLSPVVQGFSYGELTFLGYDPSGRWLVNGGHGVYTLIDPETGKLIGKLSPTFVDSFEDQGIFDLLPIPSFSCDGSRMVAYARGNDLLFWQLDLESWEIAACRMANRSMTPDEWKTYLGDLPYNATCP